jgi:hypothetical protein
MRVANLKAYFVFYDNVLQITAGQTCWKEDLEDGAEGHFETFATPALYLPFQGIDHRYCLNPGSTSLVILL